MADLYTAGISKNEFVTTTPTNNSNLADTVLSSLNSVLKTALFMEALRNLNWSRGYCWYVELDGVPSPFQRGGVLGLPAKSVSFNLGKGGSFTWQNGVVSLSVPKGDTELPSIQMELMDDEQGTLRQFFERWYNQVYNPYYGVLPVTEACKCLTVYYQKSTRRNCKRVYYDLDSTISQVASSLTNGILKKVSRSTEGLDFYVYPIESSNIGLQTNSNDLISFNVTLQCAHFANQDFGPPNTHHGISTILDTAVGSISDGSSWLDKLADYI